MLETHVFMQSQDRVANLQAALARASPDAGTRPIQPPTDILYTDTSILWVYVWFDKQIINQRHQQEGSQLEVLNEVLFGPLLVQTFWGNSQDLSRNMARSTRDQSKGRTIGHQITRITSVYIQ